MVVLCESKYKLCTHCSSFFCVVIITGLWADFVGTVRTINEYGMNITADTMMMLLKELSFLHLILTCLRKITVQCTGIHFS